MVGDKGDGDVDVEVLAFKVLFEPLSVSVPALVLADAPPPTGEKSRADGDSADGESADGESAVGERAVVDDGLAAVDGVCAIDGEGEGESSNSNSADVAKHNV